MSLGRTQIWRLHTELYKFVWKVSANNSQTVRRTDLRFGQMVYLSFFYCVTVKTTNKLGISSDKGFKRNYIDFVLL